MRIIACITPVGHLEGVLDLLKTKGEVLELETVNSENFSDLLTFYRVNTIFCNPNKQSYILGKEILEGTPVKLINTCSTGLNHIDMEYCKKNEIEVLSLKEDFELLKDLPSTSELAFGLMLSLLRKIPEGKEHVKGYNWDYTEFVGRQLKGLTIGIVGYGRLGKMMAHFCKAFGMSIKVYDPYVTFPGCYKATLKELFEESDVISLHVHVDGRTKYMINEELLACSKRKPYIINTSRGEIVNEVELVDQLRKGNISGYGADVLEDEFGTLKDSPIIQAMNAGENIIVTPHVGGMTIEGQSRAYKWAINKL